MLGGSGQPTAKWSVKGMSSGTGGLFCKEACVRSSILPMSMLRLPSLSGLSARLKPERIRFDSGGSHLAAVA